MSKHIVTHQQELEAKRAYWHQIIAKWTKSGQTPSDYCHSNGINLDHFYYWRRKNTKNIANGDLNKFIALQIDNSATHDKQPSKILPKQQTLQLDVTLPNNVNFKLSACISSLQELVTCFGGIKC